MSGVNTREKADIRKRWEANERNRQEASNRTLSNAIKAGKDVDTYIGDLERVAKKEELELFYALLKFDALDGKNRSAVKFKADQADMRMTEFLNSLPDMNMTARKVLMNEWLTEMGHF